MVTKGSGVQCTVGTMNHICTDMWLYLLDKQVLHELVSARCLCESRSERCQWRVVESVFFLFSIPAHMKPFDLCFRQGSLTTKNTKIFVGAVVA